jgi:hypothetical protein
VPKLADDGDVVADVAEKRLSAMARIEALGIEAASERLKTPITLWGT